MRFILIQAFGLTLIKQGWRSLSCPCDSCRNPVIPVESCGIQWNHFWQGALPKLLFQGPFIPVELSHSRFETGMVLEWTRTESGGMQLNRFIYLFILQLYFYLYFNNICQMYYVFATSWVDRNHMHQHQQRFNINPHKQR